MVNRTRPQPRGRLQGRYRIAPELIERTREVLSAFYEAGRHEGGHEGICFWAGTERPGITTLDAVIVPIAKHGPHSVFVSASEFANAASKAHAMGIGIVAQVHSHPSWDTRHSDGDDELVLMPFERMLSLVAPFFGRTVASITDFSAHQFHNHQWVLCSKDSVLQKFAPESNE